MPNYTLRTTCFGYLFVSLRIIKHSPSTLKNGRMKHKVGLFGGSFNPIHNGHIAIGRTMLDALSLDEVWYMVSPENPWKRGADDLAPEAVRYATVKAALMGEGRLVASDYEFHLPKPSYTWNTLQHLEQDYPDHQFVLIVGGDNWERFSQWAHAEDIVKRYEIAVFPRSGADLGEPSVQGGNISIVNVPLIDITSTRIRQMLKNGEDVSNLVPKSIQNMLSPWA